MRNFAKAKFSENTTLAKICEFIVNSLIMSLQVRSSVDLTNWPIRISDVDRKINRFPDEPTGS